MKFLFAFRVLVAVSMGTMSLLEGCAATSQYGESLRTPVPPGYVRESLASTDGLEHVEMRPAGQNTRGWTEMVETQTFKGGVEEGDPVHFAEWMASAWKDDCPGGSVGAVDSTSRNGYPAAFWRMDCPRQSSTGKPAHVLTLALEGDYAFYTVQKTWRGDPEEKDVTSWTRSFFGAVVLCDTAKREHPCTGVGEARR